MKCSCGVAFCWLCGKAIDDDTFPAHFQWWNPVGCANLQMNESNAPSIGVRICARLLAILQLIIFGPLTICSTVVCSFLCCCCITFKIQLDIDEKKRFGSLKPQEKSYCFQWRQIMSNCMSAWGVFWMLVLLALPLGVSAGAIVLSLVITAAVICCPCYCIYRISIEKKYPWPDRITRFCTSQYHYFQRRQRLRQQAHQHNLSRSSSSSSIQRKSAINSIISLSDADRLEAEELFSSNNNNNNNNNTVVTTNPPATDPPTHSSPQLIFDKTAPKVDEEEGRDQRKEHFLSTNSSEEYTLSDQLEQEIHRAINNYIDNSTNKHQPTVSERQLLLHQQQYDSNNNNNNTNNNRIGPPPSLQRNTSAQHNTISSSSSPIARPLFTRQSSSASTTSTSSLPYEQLTRQLTQSTLFATLLTTVINMSDDPFPDVNPAPTTTSNSPPTTGGALPSTTNIGDIETGNESSMNDNHNNNNNNNEATMSPITTTTTTTPATNPPSVTNIEVIDRHINRMLRILEGIEAVSQQQQLVQQQRLQQSLQYQQESDFLERNPLSRQTSSNSNSNNNNNNNNNSMASPSSNDHNNNTNGMV
jgi:hypothetical protein